MGGVKGGDPLGDTGDSWGGGVDPLACRGELDQGDPPEW